MKLLAWVFTLCAAVPAFAATGMISTTVEPIVGYERVQKFTPTQHTKERLVIGARVTAGMPLISAEGEFTHATDTEDFTSPIVQTIQETEERARVGARSTLKLSGFVNFFVRAGGQARLVRRDTTISGVTTTVMDPIRYNPYAGAGLRITVSNNIALNADLTVTFRAFPDMTQNDYMTTASVSVSFP